MTWCHISFVTWWPNRHVVISDTSQESVEFDTSNLFFSCFLQQTCIFSFLPIVLFIHLDDFFGVSCQVGVLVCLLTHSMELHGSRLEVPKEAKRYNWTLNSNVSLLKWKPCSEHGLFSFDQTTSLKGIALQQVMCLWMKAKLTKLAKATAQPRTPLISGMYLVSAACLCPVKVTALHC